MVRITEHKLIIEIETDRPADTLEVYQNSLIDALNVFDYEQYGKEPTLPVYSLIQETFTATTQPGKLIIMYNTEEPKEGLNYWQNGLNDILSLHDYEMYGSHMVKPLFELLRQTTNVVFKPTE